jgi:hypothetical protein
MRFNLPAAASWIVGALSLSSPFKKFLDTYFWDGVLHMVEPLSRPALALVVEYGPAVAFGVLGLYLSTSPADRAAIWTRVRKKLSIYYVVAIVAALVFVGAMLGAWFDYRRGPVIWKMTMPNAPLAWEASGSGPLYFIGFQIVGNNRSNNPISPSAAYIQSNVTGARVPLTFPHDNPIASGIIQPGATFYLIGPRPPNQTTASFVRQEFGSFTFVFESPQKNYSIRLERSDIDALIALADREIKREPAPTVIFREGGG